MFQPSGPNFLLSWREKLNFCSSFNCFSLPSICFAPPSIFLLLLRFFFYSSFDLFCSSLEFSLELEIDFLSLWRKAAGFKTTQTTKLGSVELSCTNVETVSTEREANFPFWILAKQHHLIQLKLRYHSKVFTWTTVCRKATEYSRIGQAGWLLKQKCYFWIIDCIFIFFCHFCYFHTCSPMCLEICLHMFAADSPFQMSLNFNNLEKYCCSLNILPAVCKIKLISYFGSEILTLLVCFWIVLHLYKRAFNWRIQGEKSLKPDSLWGLIGVLQRHLEEADWEVFVHLGGDPQPGVCDLC